MLSDNPQEYLKSLKKPVIIDEIQYLPELTQYLKILIDEDEQELDMYHDFRLFFLASAWDRVCEFLGIQDKNDDLSFQFANICSFLGLTRRDVLCEVFHGQQIRDKEQVKAYKLIANIISDETSNFEKKMKELDDF